MSKNKQINLKINNYPNQIYSEIVVSNFVISWLKKMQILFGNTEMETFETLSVSPKSGGLNSDRLKKEQNCLNWHLNFSSLLEAFSYSNTLTNIIIF